MVISNCILCTSEISQLLTAVLPLNLFTVEFTISQNINLKACCIKIMLDIIHTDHTKIF